MKTRILPTALAALLLPLAALAADEGQLVDVVATGHGSTVREATKAALRAAVEQVVGTMVDATTLVENDELIEDEILQYSAGMVESSKTIGEPKKSADGFYTVKIKATVKKRQVEEKLRTASSVNVALDGADLFARMTAAQDNLADAEAMIKDVLAKHLACVVAEAVPGENGTSPLDLDPKTGEVFANIRVRIDMAKYKQFVKEVLDKLGPMAESRDSIQATARNRSPFEGSGQMEKAFPGAWRDKMGQNILIVLTDPRSGKAEWLQFEKNISSAVRTCLCNGSIAVSVLLSDSSGNEIGSRNFAVHEERDKSCTWYISLFAWSDDTNGEWPNAGFILPWFGGSIAHDSDFKGQKYGVSTFPGGPVFAEKTFRIFLGNFTADELKTFGKLELKLGHMKDGQFTE